MRVRPGYRVGRTRAVGRRAQPSVNRLFQFITEQTGYALDLLRQTVDFTLYRGHRYGRPPPVLMMALVAEQPSAQSLRRAEREYSLAEQLHPAWAAKPVAFTRHQERTILVLQDPGGEPPARILEQELAPLDLPRALRIAVGLAMAVGQVDGQGLIHKDLKPHNDENRARSASNDTMEA